MSTFSRRQFVKNLSGLVSFGVLAGFQSGALAAEERRRGKKPEAGATAAGGSLPMVDPATDPMAKSVNYAPSHADVKKAELKTERQGVKWDQQFCDGCGLHQPIAGKKDVVTCTLFQGKGVHAKGWCSSWAKKS